MAQLVLGVAGAAVGSLFGMPQLGWAIGSAIGASMAPAQKVQGPRLSDLKVTGTEYGQAIPWVQGHPAIAGQIWYASDRREIATTTSQGGKGGPTVESTTYSYEVDLLIGLTDNVIAGVTRIWANGKLVWSNLSGVTYQTASGPSTAFQSASSLVASQTTDLWRRMTVYTGAATQLPDPTYEAAVGIANAPAYRGRGSVFIEGLQLGSGGQIPNLTFEVATSIGSTTGVVTDLGFIGTDYRVWGPIVVDDVGITAHGRDAYASVNTSIKRLTHAGFLENLGNYAITTPSNSVSSGNQTTTSDVPILIAFKTAVGTPFTYQVYDGSTVTEFLTPETSNSWPALYKDGSLYLQPQAGLKKVYRYAGGAIATSSSAMSVDALNMASDGTYLYVLDINGANIIQMDATTLAVVTTFAGPVGGSSNDRIVLVNERNELFVGAGTSLYRYDAPSWTQVNPALGVARIMNQSGGTVTTRHAMRGNVLYTFATEAAAGATAGHVYAAAPAVPLVDETLQNVVSRLCLRAGLSAGQFDVTALGAITKPVRALAVAQVSNTRAVLELLMSAYYFEAVCSDKIYFRPRGGASVATIPYADLGASTDPNGAAEPLALHPANELEIPAQVAVSYLNVDREYQTDTQYSDRLLSTATTVASVQMALGFNPAEAKGIANAMVMDQVASWLTSKVQLLPAYSRLEPTDVVTVTAGDGTTLRMRLVKKVDRGSVLEYDVVLDDATVLTHAGITALDNVPSIIVAQGAGTVLQLLDIPILRDADNDVGIYAAVKGSGSPYAGASVLSSRDAVEYSEVATVTESDVIGTCTTTLGDWLGGNVFDETSSVTVSVGLGTLASVTRDNLLDAGTNACVIGSEVLQFRDVALVSTGVYTLSGLLRGRRGTEANMVGHGAGERFVLLQSRGIRRVQMQTSDIGVLKYYKGVTLGRRLSSAAAQSLTLQSVGSRPFSPVDLRAARDPGTGDITFTWSRRTRLSKNFSNGTVPLGEASESYDIVIYTSNTFATVKRTLSATTPTVAYTSAQQVSDFGSNQATVYVRVYQISAVVGRGNPAQGAL